MCWEGFSRPKDAPMKVVKLTLRGHAQCARRDVSLISPAAEVIA